VAVRFSKAAVERRWQDLYQRLPMTVAAGIVFGVCRTSCFDRAAKAYGSAKAPQALGFCVTASAALGINCYISPSSFAT
jgi:hypothetical protein